MSILFNLLANGVTAFIGEEDETETPTITAVRKFSRVTGMSGMPSSSKISPLGENTSTDDEVEEEANQMRMHPLQKALTTATVVGAAAGLAIAGAGA
jgi:hypothetical protein